MTTENRLAKPSEGRRITPPTDPVERVKFWVNRGNALLAGTEPTTKGEYLAPRRDVHWFVDNGRAVIGWRR